jgi:hypothetical protein
MNFQTVFTSPGYYKFWQIDNSGGKYFIEIFFNHPKPTLGKRKVREEIFTPDFIRRIQQKDNSPTEEVSFFDIITCGDIEENPGPISVENIYTNGFLNGYQISTISNGQLIRSIRRNRSQTVSYIRKVLLEIHFPKCSLLPNDICYWLASKIYLCKDHPEACSCIFDLYDLINEILGMPKEATLFDHAITSRKSLWSFTSLLRTKLPREIQLLIGDTLFDEYQQQRLLLAGDVEENPGPQLDFIFTSFY